MTNIGTNRRLFFRQLFGLSRLCLSLLSSLILAIGMALFSIWLEKMYIYMRIIEMDSTWNGMLDYVRFVEWSWYGLVCHGNSTGNHGLCSQMKGVSFTFSAKPSRPKQWTSSNNSMNYASKIRNLKGVDHILIYAYIYNLYIYIWISYKILCYKCTCFWPRILRIPSWDLRMPGTLQLWHQQYHVPGTGRCDPPGFCWIWSDAICVMNAIHI